MLFYTFINRVLAFFIVLFFFGIIKKPFAYALISFIVNIFLSNYIDFKGDLEQLEDKFKMIIVAVSII